MSKTSKIYEHAVRELRHIGLLGSGDPMPRSPTFLILDLIDRISDSDHNEGSYDYVLNTFTKLADFMPLSPLTGEDREWEGSIKGRMLNKRCSRIFKDASGQAYDTEAICFEHEDGRQEFRAESIQPISFPYMPNTIIQQAKD